MEREHPSEFRRIDRFLTRESALSTLESTSTSDIWVSCHRNATHRSWKTTPFLLCRGLSGILPVSAARTADCPMCISAGAPLSESHPRLLRELSATLNGSLNDSDLTTQSETLVWWNCSRGHEWMATVQSRVRGSGISHCRRRLCPAIGCPFCLAHLKSHRQNLLDACPAIERQWHESLNGSLEPSMVCPHSRTFVYWKCPKSQKHIWLAAVCSRLKADNSMSACPYCCRLVAPRDESFGVLHHEMLSQWDYTRNGAMDPFRILPTSPRSAWWRCLREDSHKWRMPIHRMARSDHFCPVCHAAQEARSKNAMLDASQQWDSEWNYPLSPENVSPESSLLVCWRCQDNPDHFWYNTMHNHKFTGYICPICESTRNEEDALRTRGGELQLDKAIASEILSSCAESRAAEAPNDPTDSSVAFPAAGRPQGTLSAPSFRFTWRTMGITGLLPFLRPVTRSVNLSELRGKRCAVDGLCWMHKAKYSCSIEFALGERPSEFLKYCMKMVSLLVSNGITPIIVFDGDSLPLKSGENSDREQRRKENRQKGLEYRAAGDAVKARQFLLMSVDVDPSMTRLWVEKLIDARIEYIVAPYEADAQLYYLNREHFVDFVVTDDSDILVYGTSSVLFKLNSEGQGDLVEVHQVYSHLSFTREQFMTFCILSGCDYLPSLPRVGIKTAFNAVQSFRTDSAILSSLTSDQSYWDGFQLALNSFRSQTVFDYRTFRAVPLTPHSLSEDKAFFLGPLVADDIAYQISHCLVHPITYPPPALTLRGPPDASPAQSSPSRPRSRPRRRGA